MTDLPDYWRLSIAAAVEDPPVGNAFVIDEGRALTCAHLFEEAPLRDAEHVWVRRLGHPAVPWRMPRSRIAPLAQATDICVLPVPRSFGAVAARLGARLRPEPPTVIRAFGFPYGSESVGEWAEAEVIGPDASGSRLQVRDRGPGAKITQGYSGGAAVDAVTSLVVGMVARADRVGSESRNAWLIPLDVLAENVGDMADLLASDYAAKQDYVAAQEALRERRYDDAAHLFYVLGQRNDVAVLHYYTALARLRGRAPHELSRHAVEKVVSELRRARQLDTGCVEAAALWALVKEDYYRLQGLPVGQPTIDELTDDLWKITRDHATEIVTHVPAPSSPTWLVLRHRSTAEAR